MIIDTMPWPLVTIDFEASSLDAGTYPIEVGVCRWRSPNLPIEGWSTLIVPTPAWREHGSWSTLSQRVHGIVAVELDGGLAATATVAALNDIVGGHAAFCDGGIYDQHWAYVLAQAAGVRLTWTLGDFDHLSALLDRRGHARMVRFMCQTPIGHRARDDAERLMRALAQGLGVKPAGSVAIAPLDHRDATPV